jgi:hypothetical protein
MCVRLVVVGLTVFGLTACSSVLPRTVDLQTVHETYRRELADLAFPEPHSNPDQIGVAEAAKATRPFRQTLSAIEDYRRRYPEAKTELAHLQVLEGMTYVQSEQFGLAKAVETEVREPRALLDAAASMTPRDALFAESYSALLRGWQITCEPSAEIAGQVEQSNILSAQADHIVAALCQAEANGRLAQARGDQGAMYLAMAAAVFDVAADWRPANQCIPQYEAICRERISISCITRLILTACQELPPGAGADPSRADAISKCQQCTPFMQRHVSAQRLLHAHRILDHFMSDAGIKALNFKAQPESSSLREEHQRLLAASLNHPDTTKVNDFGKQ